MDIDHVALARQSTAIQDRASDAILQPNESRYWVSHDEARRLKVFMGLVDERRNVVVPDLGFITTQSFELIDGRWVCVAIQHYMPVEWASREIDAAERLAKSQIREVVRDEVRRGLEQVANDYLHQIRQIDEQIAQLKAERVALEAAESNRQARQVEREKARVTQANNVASGKGFVYLLRAVHDSTLFKIGCTTNPKNRLKAFGVKLPFPVDYDCLIATDDMYNLEGELHARFASKRLDGEWFRLSAEDADYIRLLSNKGSE